MKEDNSVLPEPQLSTNQRAVALFAANLAAFFTSFMVSGLNVALPRINEEFKADAVLLGWVVTSYVLVIAVLSLPMGRIADIVGVKRILLYGVIIYTIASVLAVFSNSIIMLIVCRLIQGIGTAMIICNLVALLSVIYPVNERGRVFGLNIACVYIGMSLGPPVGGIMTQYLGWRSIFLINLPLALPVILLLAWKIRIDWSSSQGEKFDTGGSVIYGIALAALIYGFSLLPDISGGILAIIGIAGLFIFLKWESRIKNPVLNIKIFHNNKVLILSYLSNLINTIGTYAPAFLISLYLQYIKGLTPGQAGLILVVQAATQAVLSPFTGRLSDILESRTVTSAGMVFTFIGLLLLSLLAENTPLLWIIMMLIISGIGLALFSSPNVNTVMNSVTHTFYGIASAVLVTTRGVGQSLSMGITVVVMALIVGKVAITPEYYPELLTSIKIIFGIFSALCFVGIFTSFYRSKARNNSPNPR